MLTRPAPNVRLTRVHREDSVHVKDTGGRNKRGARARAAIAGAAWEALLEAEAGREVRAGSSSSPPVASPPSPIRDFVQDPQASKNVARCRWGGCKGCRSDWDGRCRGRTMEGAQRTSKGESGSTATLLPSSISDTFRRHRFRGRRKHHIGCRRTIRRCLPRGTFG